MGIGYHLECKDCLESFDSYQKSSDYEYSIVGYVESKFPDDCVEQVKEWTEFIAKHSSHRICLVDERGNESNPAKTTGQYVLGITNKVGDKTFSKLHNLDKGNVK